MTDNGAMPDIPIEMLAETENYSIWRAEEPDDEITYHVELGPVTAHFFPEEWEEFLELVREADAEEAEEQGETKAKNDAAYHVDDDDIDEDDIEIELDWGSLFFTRDEWDEFMELIEQLEDEE